MRSEGRNLRVGERRERSRERIMRGKREGTQGEMKRKEKGIIKGQGRRGRREREGK